MRKSDFFQDAFTKCVHIRKFLDIKGPELHRGHKNKISSYNNLPKRNSSLPTELCRTRAVILNPMLDQTLLASQITKI